MADKLSILKEILGPYRIERKGQYLFQCPNPSCRHHKPKLAINLNSGGKCWICDMRSPNLRFFVKRFGNRDQLAQWDKITGEIDLSNKRASPLDRPEEIEERVQVNLPPEFRSLTSNAGIAGSPAMKYLTNRGIDEQDIIRWKIGFANEGKYRDRIIIPSFNLDGDLDYFIARTYTDDWIKYLNPDHKHDIVFNELFIDWHEDVVLVEGVFDAIVAGNAIPLLTSTLREESKLFSALVKHNPDVYLALDPDAKRKEQKIALKLKEYGLNVFKIEVEPYADVGKMSKIEFAKRKSEATFLDSSAYLRYRLH